MTIKNIKAGFKVTGIHPFNRSAISLPEESFEKFKPEALSSDNGINYIPFYTSSSLIPRKDTKRFICDSETESDDLESDEDGLNDSTIVLQTTLSSAQSTPLQKSLPSTLSQTPAKPLPYVSKFGQLLQLPKPPSKIPTKRGKSSGRVLTSEECLSAMEEKEKQKQEAARLKEERRLQRELNKKLKVTKSKGKSVCISVRFTTCIPVYSG